MIPSQPQFNSTRLGHGIGLRAEFFTEILAGATPRVDFMELVSENFFQQAGRAWKAAEMVRAQMPVALHGIGMGIGDESGPTSGYLEQLATLIERLEPKLVSDHLCWTSLAGHHTHDLLPLPRTTATLERVVQNVDRVQQTLRRQILLENISAYVEFQENEMGEAEFLREVVTRTGCGLLLDVNNVVVNATNHGFCAHEFLSLVPRQAVQLLHVAGHTLHPDTEESQLLIDTHVGPVPDNVRQLYSSVCAQFGALPTLVEWDEDVPELSRVVQESEQMRSISLEARARMDRAVSA